MIGLLAACGSNESESTENAVAHNHYSCPMECEGDKEYDEAGTCPVCGMDLELVMLDEEASDSE